MSSFNLKERNEEVLHLKRFQESQEAFKVGCPQPTKALSLTHTRLPLTGMKWRAEAEFFTFYVWLLTASNISLIQKNGIYFCCSNNLKQIVCNFLFNTVPSVTSPVDWAEKSELSPQCFPSEDDERFCLILSCKRRKERQLYKAKSSVI